MENNGSRRCKFRNKKGEIWMDRHTLRKDDGEIPKAALPCNPHGITKRGRQKNSWRISVITEAGRSWKELRFLAADGQKRKELVDMLRF
jgi:hypothetical protein